MEAVIKRIEREIEVLKKMGGPGVERQVAGLVEALLFCEEAVEQEWHDARLEAPILDGDPHRHLRTCLELGEAKPRFSAPVFCYLADGSSKIGHYVYGRCGAWWSHADVLLWRELPRPPKELIERAEGP